MTARISGALRASTALGLVATLLAAAPIPAHADEVVAVDAASPVAAHPGTITAPAITAAASVPRGIVVANHAGRPVTLFAKGETIRRSVQVSGRPVTFTGLTPGRVYTIEVLGVRVGALRALDRPAPASGLTVRSTATADTVALSWSHHQTPGTGGPTVTYRITAVSRTAPTLRATVRQHRATLTGLDPEALYTFTVVPQNSAGVGRATRASMTKALGRPVAAPPVPTAVDTPREQAALPVPAVAPPAPPPAPPAAPPASRTIYRCPAGYVETADGLCRTTLPYTTTTKAYTFHAVVTGPSLLLDSYETSASGCPSGYSLEDYVFVKYCRRYSPAPTAQVKDEPPAGYSDDGTQWVTRDPAPIGYSDDGTQWVKTVAKEAVVVPA